MEMRDAMPGSRIRARDLFRVSAAITALTWNKGGLARGSCPRCLICACGQAMAGSMIVKTLFLAKIIHRIGA